MTGRFTSRFVFVFYTILFWLAAWTFNVYWFVDRP